MNFPKKISFTLTNRCNLNCRMCGQWSEHGYMRNRDSRRELGLAEWKGLVDQLAEHNIDSLLLRGGEIFLMPEIMELIRYINSKGIFISIDTNGTLLSRFAADLAELTDIHLTISIDGPQAIHDRVRGVNGCFAKTAAGIRELNRLEQQAGKGLSKSICFTISGYSYRGLGELPQIARDLGIQSITIVPFYYIPQATGTAYEQVLTGQFDCPAYSWKGFHHETSGVDIDEFLVQLNKYKKNLHEIHDYPFLPLSDAQYRTWFTNTTEPVVPHNCMNVEKLIDIQPDGRTNFCVDFPDFAFGNVQEATIAELWNNPQAEKFREYRRESPLPVCHRCGAKFMSEIEG